MAADKVEVLLEEYRALRAEVDHRIQHQLFTLGGSVALIAAVIGLVPDMVANQQVLGLLAFPLAFSVLGWMHFEQEVLLVAVAAYLHRKLRPALARALGESEQSDILGWEQFKSEHLDTQPSGRTIRSALPLFRVAATMGPALLALLLVAHIMFMRERAIDAWEVTLFAFDALVFSFLVHLQRRLHGRIYRLILDESADARRRGSVRLGAPGAGRAPHA